MKYNFDKPTDRRNTNSLKWNVNENELPMWVADMDFETLPEVKAAVMKTAELGIYGYSDIPDDFFREIAEFWQRRYGFHIDTSSMVYSSGIVAAISSMVRKLTTPAENVLIQAPVYNIFYNSILNNGRNVLSSDLVYKDGEYSIDFADLEEKMKNPQTSLMILCNPHNPVGKIWDRETLRKIGHLAHKHSVTVISDEIHFSFTAPGKKYVPFASVDDICVDISVTCISASKCFNLAGLQSACIVAKNPTLRHRVYRGINTDEVGEPNIFSMNANIAAFRHGDEWIDELNEYIFANKRFACDYIRDNIPSIKAPFSEATYLLWADISALSDDSVAFCKDLREKTGLYISDGTEYGACAKSFVRINLATQRSNVERGMKLLKEYVDKYCR